MTEHGRDFLEHPAMYRDFSLHTLVNIVGTEIIKNNKILPICTYYLESDDGDVLFIADYCSPKEAKQLEAKIKKELKITMNKRFEIVEAVPKEKNQEMIKYIAYSNPDIRSVLFTGSVKYGNNEVSIQKNRLLLNQKETSPREFLIRLFSPDDSVEKKIELAQEVEKKKAVLFEIAEYLAYIATTLENESVIPKLVEYEGEDQPSILFKTEQGRYNAIVIGKEKPVLLAKIKIAGNCSWGDISKAIEENDYINNTKEDNLIEQLLGGMDLDA